MPLSARYMAALPRDDDASHLLQREEIQSEARPISDWEQIHSLHITPESMWSGSRNDKCPRTYSPTPTCLRQR